MFRLRSESSVVNSSSAEWSYNGIRNLETKEDVFVQVDFTKMMVIAKQDILLKVCSPWSTVSRVVLSRMDDEECPTSNDVLAAG